MKFEDLAPMIIMTMVVWEMTPCSLVESCQRFGGTY